MGLKVCIHDDGLGTPTSCKGYAPGIPQTVTGPSEAYVVSFLKELVKIRINWLKQIDFNDVQYMDSEGNNLPK